MHCKQSLDGAQVASAPPSPTPLPATTDFAEADPNSPVSFRCNICSTANTVRLSQINRETVSCAGCSSTVRCRAIVDLLINALFGNDLRLDEVPVRKDIKGLGLSYGAYADPLADKFDYTNAVDRGALRVDIANPPAHLAGKHDFLISSDGFELVIPPISRAFSNARRLLKPNGVFVFTAPFGMQAKTEEYFPELFDYRIEEKKGRWTLRNRTADGRFQIYSNLIFHGPPGELLEMRLFSRAGLEREFAQAGFQEVHVASEGCLPHGIIWPEPWSVPIVARA